MSPSGILPVPNRPLRLEGGEAWDVPTSDGREIRLTRHQSGDKGPVVLAPGYGTSTLAWTIDTVETNFAEYLAENGYDVWLLDYRASPLLEAASTDYTIDDIAQRDWPAAIAKMREVSGAESVQAVTHCVGSLSFMMGMTSGLEGVRSAVCSALGLHPVATPVNQARAKLRMATLMHNAGLERLSATFHEEAFEDRALEAVMKRMPTRQKCDSPVCHRIQFLYGDVFDHDKLNDETHDALVHIFGKARLTAFEHLSRMMREGHAVTHDGLEAYLPNLEQAAIPITFVTGENNRMFIPRSVELTYEALREANGDELYRLEEFSGYAHMDCWIGENADRDVFPFALRELERFN